MILQNNYLVNVHNQNYFLTKKKHRIHNPHLKKIFIISTKISIFRKFIINIRLKNYCLIFLIFKLKAILNKCQKLIFIVKMSLLVLNIQNLQLYNYSNLF